MSESGAGSDELAIYNEDGVKIARGENYPKTADVDPDGPMRGVNPTPKYQPAEAERKRKREGSDAE